MTSETQAPKMEKARTLKDTLTKKKYQTKLETDFSFIDSWMSNDIQPDFDHLDTVYSVIFVQLVKLQRSSQETNKYILLL